VSQTYRIADITDQQVDLIVRESGGDPGLRQALAPIVAARAIVAGLNAELNSRAVDMKRIEDDQMRVRENMKALRGSSEEQQLLKRYATQLTQQEDRVDALRKETDDLERRRRDAQAELARLVDSLTTEVAVTP
jgi:chromosome segregation ATPase